MRLRTLGVGLTIGAAAIATTMLVGPNAHASGRPCGDGVSTVGHGTLGSPFTLKSKYDDDGPVPGVVVVGEEFEINTPAGQVWNVQLADNGLIFFNQPVTADAQGLKAMGQTTAQKGNQVMTAHAVNTANGEVVDGSVTLLGPPPPRCGTGH